VKWEFEVEEGWLPYRTLTSNIFGGEKEFVNLGKMAKWMEINRWWKYYFDPLSPEGAYQLGSPSHAFYVGCIQ
jgi:hypothetical protein